MSSLRLNQSWLLEVWQAKRRLLRDDIYAGLKRRLRRGLGRAGWIRGQGFLEHANGAVNGVRQGANGAGDGLNPLWRRRGYFARRRVDSFGELFQV